MFISIIAIWLAVIIMVSSVPDFSIVTAQLLAVSMTCILFVIGFKRS